MRRRGFLVTILTLLITLVATVGQGADAIRLFIDDRELFPDVPPLVEAGRTLVPLRAVVEPLGAAIQWDQPTQTITITGKHTVVMTIGSTSATVDGQARTLEVPPRIEGGRTLVPVRFVAEAFGYTVQWDNTLRAIRLVSPAPPSNIKLELQEVVNAQVDKTNSDNGVEARIIRTGAGVFTAYLGADRQYRLDQRTPAGWITIRDGGTPAEAPQVLRGPDDKAYLLEWYDGSPLVWAASADGKVAQVGALWSKFEPLGWHDAAAAISPEGDIYIVNCGRQPATGGLIEWATFNTATAKFGSLQTLTTDSHYADAIVVPGANHELNLVAGRNAKWDALGLQKPGGASADYLENALKLWHSPNVTTGGLTPTLIFEDPPTAKEPQPWVLVNRSLGDAMLDTQGRLHVLYYLHGAATGGQDITHHAIYQNGRLVKDSALPFVGFRMIQDTQGKLYFFGRADSHTLTIYPAIDADGYLFGDAILLPLGDYPLGVASPYLAAPRTGTPPADYVDAVYPTSDQVPKWVYIRIRLR